MANKRYIPPFDDWGPDQHLWWKFFSENQDSFFKLDDWPEWVKALMMKWHKSDSNMYNLMYFFVGNGLAPHIAFRWVMGGQMEVRNGVWTMHIGKQYKASEIYDAERVLDKAKAGELLTGKKRVFDMNSRRVVWM